MKALFVEDAEKVGVVAHQPDHELSPWSDAGVDGGVLDIGGLSFLIFDEKIDLRVCFDAWVDLTRASLQLVVLRLWVIVGEWCGGGDGGLNGEGRKNKKTHKNDT